MTNGPFFKKILAFSVPLMMTGVLQLIYNAADSVVVGRFAGAVSLAAVGSTGSVVALIVNLFVGFSTGSGAVVARHIGEEDNRAMHRSVHTTMTLSLICGLIVCAVGVFFSGAILKAMDTPADVLPLSTLYLKIYFMGAPGSLVFNFGASVVRANGDTKRPLAILSLSGLVNVGLNLLLVIVFKMDVAGVAIATITSQYISAVMIVIRLCRLPNACRLSLSRLRLYSEEVKDILRIGFPAGLQSVLFSLSNVIIQSTVNGFGSNAMAGNAAAANADAFIYVCTNSVSQTAMIFTSQNMGAKKYENVTKIYYRCLLFAGGVGIALGILGLCFPTGVISLFSKDASVISYGVSRLKVMMPTYFLCGLMDVAGWQLRGMGCSVEPMILTLIGACGLRILWIYTVFPFRPTLGFLYVSYPVSWILTFLALFILFYYKRKKLCR